MTQEIWSPRSFVASGHRGRTLPPLVLVLACLLLAGCRLDLAAEASVGADGSGVVGLVAGFDAALLSELDALAVDPTAELEAAARGQGWEFTRRTTDGTLEVAVTRRVGASEEIGEAFRGLSAGLGAGDPALLIDLEVTLDDEGGAEVTGTAGFRPPATAGVSVDDVPLGPDADALRAAAASSIAPRLTIELPGRVQEHDGDRLLGRSVVWELPVGATRQVGASSAPPSWWAPWFDRLARVPAGVLVGLGAALLTFGLGTYLLVRRDRHA